MNKYFVATKFETSGIAHKNEAVIEYIDNMTGDYYGLPVETVKNLLNKQQSDYIKVATEKEKYKKLALKLIGDIDILMHDKQYRFLNDNGTWYSREACKNLTDEEMLSEISKEINQLYNKLEEIYE